MAKAIRTAFRYVGQALIYAAVAAVVGYFSTSPSYTHFPPDKALITLSFAHGGKPKGGCRTLTESERAKLAPNMRRKQICPRRRLPVGIELDIDGQKIYKAELPPTGLSGDGPSRVYRRFVVSVGRHRIAARLRDTARRTGYDYRKEATVTLAPGQQFIIDFRPSIGGFVFQ